MASQNHDLLITSARRAALGQFFLGRLLYKYYGEPPSFPVRRRIFAELFAGHEARRNAGKKGGNEVEDL
jgi:hypothetical protein